MPEDRVVATVSGGVFAYDGQPHGAIVAVTGLPDGYAAEAFSEASVTDVEDGEVPATVDGLVIRNEQGDDVNLNLNLNLN